MIKTKAVSAVLWSGADIFFRQGFQFIVTIILARLLSPEEYGTIALLYLFTGLASLFVNCGFSSALIQMQDITHTDESTVFWFNLGMGITTAFGLWQFAPWIADFYSKPVLIPLMGVLALNLLIGALASIHSILLTKRLDFKVQMRIGVFSAVISGVVAVVLAWQGYGVWSLAWQSLTATVLTTILLWKLNDWRPNLVFSYISIQRLFRFGGYLMFSGLLDTAYNRLYTVLIGKQYGAWDLGIYDRAYGTQQLPAGILTSILSRVTFPIFSAVAENKEKLRSGVRHALRGIMLINIPLMLGLLVTADAVLLTLFGEKWVESAPILRVLCLAGILWPLHVINVNVLMAQGHSRLFFLIEVVKKALGLIILLIAANYGVMAIAWSVVVRSVCGLFINTYYTNIHLEYGAWQQTKDCLPSLSVASFMALLVFGLGGMLSWSTPWVLLTQVCAGTLIYLTGCIIFRVKSFQDVSLLLKEQFSRFQ